MTGQGNESPGPLVVHTNAAGVYIVIDLAPGRYDVTAHAPGFSPEAITGVWLRHWQVQQTALTLGDLPSSA